MITPSLELEPIPGGIGGPRNGVLAMKSLITILIASLLGVSAVAMAENGGDRVVAQMDAARQEAMHHYAQVEQPHAHAQSVASSQDQAAHRVERTN